MSSRTTDPSHDARSDGELGTALTGQVAHDLCHALREHPTREMAAASCGVTQRVVENWLRRGQVPGAHPLLAQFAISYLAAEAAFASWIHGQWMTAMSEGNCQVAREYAAFSAKRWQAGSSQELMAIASAGPKRTDDLRAALLHPSARLLALLTETGWTRPADWRERPPAQLTAAPEDTSDADG